MPKRVAEEAKRVSLNCLVSPATLQWLKDAQGSQGELVDRAVAELALYEQRAASPQKTISEVFTKPETILKPAPPPTRFKGPLLKPSERESSKT